MDSEGVHTSAIPLHLLMVFGTGSLGCEPPLHSETPPLGFFWSFPTPLDGLDQSW